MQLIPFVVRRSIWQPMFADPITNRHTIVYARDEHEALAQTREWAPAEETLKVVGCCYF